MDIEHIQEPRLLFAKGTHICPRRGIAEYGVFDQTQATRRKEIYVGGIGTSNCVDLLGKWIEQCRSVITVLPDVKQENLRLPFCGFNSSNGFGVDINFSSDLSRTLKNSEVKEIINIKNRTKRILKAIEHYYDNIKFLAQNRHVDVIVCVIPEILYKVIATEERIGEESLEVEDEVYEELNFRRALKAKAMPLGKPLQLMRQASLDEKRCQGNRTTRPKRGIFARLYITSLGRQSHGN